MPRRLTLIVLALLGLCAAYLLSWPVDIAPVAWEAPEDQGYSGTFAPNEALAQMKHLPLDGGYGAVAAAAADGDIFIATRGGPILRLDSASAALSPFADTQGMPLALAAGADGRLYVADARRGLLAVDAEGKITVLADRDGEGKPLGLLTGIAAAPDGTLYVTEATRKPAASGDIPTATASALLAHDGQGRLLEYDPAADRLDTLLDGLEFPAGVALARGGRLLMIAETGNYRVLALPLPNGSEKADPEALLDNLPGFPAGISRAGDGTFWLGLVAPRFRLLDMLSDRPRLRKILARLPAMLRPEPRRHGALVHFDEDGNILETLQASSGQAAFTTGAVEGPENLLFVTRLTGEAIAVLPR